MIDVLARARRTRGCTRTTRSSTSSAPALPLLRDRDRGHGLGHREPDHHRVGRHRDAGARVAEREVGDDVPAVRHVELRADLGAVGDPLFEHLDRRACELLHDSPTVRGVQRRVRFTRARVPESQETRRRWPRRRSTADGAAPAAGAQPIRRRIRPAGRRSCASTAGGRQEVGDGGHRHHPHGLRVAHLIGNLKLFLSKEEINLYGEALRDMPGHLLPRTVLLWMIRIGLIARVRVPHPLRVRPHAASTARPGPAPVPVEARLRRRRLRVAHDALDRHHRRAVPHLPPAGSHVGQREPRVRPRRSVQQPRVQPAAAGRRDRLHRRDDRARRSTCTTAPGRCSRASASTTRATTSCAGAFAQGFAALDPRRQPQLPDRGAARTGSSSQCPHTEPDDRAVRRRSRDA